MDEELQLSPDPNDLLIDLGAGNEDVTDKELNLDLLDEAEDDLPDSSPVEVVEIKNRVSLSNKLNNSSASALKDVVKVQKQTRKKAITPIKFGDSDVTNGSLENDGGLTRFPNSVEETCKNLGLKDCFISYTNDNFAQIQEYAQFKKLINRQLYRANPGAPPAKIMSLLTAKWRQFQNIRAKNYKKGVGISQNQKLDGKNPRQNDVANVSNEIKLKNKRLSKMSSGCIENPDEVTPTGSPSTSIRIPNLYSAFSSNGKFSKRVPSATSSASMSPSDTKFKSVSSFKISPSCGPIFTNNFMESPRGIKTGNANLSSSPVVPSPCSSATGGSNTFRFGSGINPLEQLRLQNLGTRVGSLSVPESSTESGMKIFEKLSSTDLEALLMRKKAEEVLKKQEEEAARQAMVQYDLMRSNVFGPGSPLNVTAQKMEISDQHEQTVASQLRITNARMQQIQKQLNIQSKMISKFENDKKQMEIDHLKALLAAKQGSTKSETKGSVRARVGPKNKFHLNEILYEDIPVTSKQTFGSDNVHEDDGERDLNQNDMKSKMKQWSTTSSLPEDLVLTNLTEDGPKPASKRIRWNEDDDEDGKSYDWKRQRK